MNTTQMVWRRIALVSLATLAPAILSACTSLSFAAANLPAVFGSYQAHRDIKYGSLERQALDVYVPAVEASRLPVVIFVYGGSWTSGSKSSYRFVAETLTLHGYVAVLPDYRLHPEVKFPAFVDDVAAAVAWTHAHIAELGGDPERIFLMGHSAGAQICALLAFDEHYLRTIGGRTAWIKGLIGLAGPYDFLPFEEQYLRDIFGPESEYSKSQPVNFVNSDTTSIPPALLIHGEDDRVVLPRNSRSLAAHMRSSGGRVVERYYPVLDHFAVMAAFSIYYRQRRPVVDEIDAFIGSVKS